MEHQSILKKQRGGDDGQAAQKSGETVFEIHGNIHVPQRIGQSFQTDLCVEGWTDNVHQVRAAPGLESRAPHQPQWSPQHHRGRIFLTLFQHIGLAAGRGKNSIQHQIRTVGLAEMPVPGVGPQVNVLFAGEHFPQKRQFFLAAGLVLLHSDPSFAHKHIIN